MTKRVPATCPNCGATELNLVLVHEAEVASLAGVQMKLQLTEVPQLFCGALVIPKDSEEWEYICNFEQNGKINNEGYAVFGKLEKTDG